MRSRRAAGLLLATLGVATWYLGGRRGHAPAALHPGAPQDPLDRLAEEVEARSDATDVVAVVEDLLTGPSEEERKTG